VGEPSAALHRNVIDKMKLRDGSHVERPGELTAKETRGMLKRLHALLGGFGPGQGSDIDLGMGKIPADFDRGDRDQADPRVLEFLAEHARQVTLNLVGNASCAGEVSRHMGRSAATDGRKPDGL